MKKNRKYGVWLFVGVIVILIGSLALLNKTTDPLAGIPNYTEIKGDFDNIQDIDYENQPSLGSEKASVKVIEFGDFKCPACQYWELNFFDDLKRDYIDTGKIQFHFMNYAFIDRDSILAASAGEAIAKQNNEAFWQFYQKMYEQQGDETKIWATQKYLLNFVKDNVDGIDFELFKKDLKEGTYYYDVKHDFKTAGLFGVNGTPSFFVNGEKVTSAKYEDLKAAIDKALEQQK